MIRGNQQAEGDGQRPYEDAAVRRALAAGDATTIDLGGKVRTADVAKAVIARLGNP